MRIAFIGRLTLACVIFCMPALFGCASSGGKNPISETRILQGDDYWHYKGEVEVRPGSATACSRTVCAQYCDYSYCAHGFGFLGTDGSWWYEGTFVHGRIEGSGTYDNDFYEYVGGFKHGNFDGHGVLTCLDGPRFEGIFVDGKFSGKHVGWVGPCE